MHGSLAEGEREARLDDEASRRKWSGLRPGAAPRAQETGARRRADGGGERARGWIGRAMWRKGEGEGEGERERRERERKRRERERERKQKKN